MTKAEPVCDGIMNAPAASHIGGLVSRHHETSDLDKDNYVFVVKHSKCAEKRNSQLTCESLAAAFLAWMMKPLNLVTNINNGNINNNRSPSL